MLKMGDDCNTIYLNGGKARTPCSLYKSFFEQKHKAPDDTTLRQTLIKALNAPLSEKTAQEDNCYRYPINGGKGYLVYKLGVVKACPTAGGQAASNSAQLIHYELDKDLSVQA